MVYQQFINYPAMTVYENIASPLQGRRRRRRPGSTARSARGRAAEADAVSAAHAAQPVGRPAAAHGARPRDRQERRPGAARRAARQSRLQAARGTARGAADASSPTAGTIFVYATTEPHEALLLGGNTATLSEGRITQFGPTIEVFRKPNDLVTARTFADPPLNTIVLRKKGASFLLDGGVNLPVPAELAGIADCQLHDRLSAAPSFSHAAERLGRAGGAPR